MIEFELKFKLNNKNFDTSNLKFIDTTTIEDIYYDTNNYILLQKGNFLRIRNDKTIDFKLSTNDNDHLFCKELNYNIDSINSKNKNFINIINSLGLSSEFDSFESFIDNNNLIVLAPIKKVRTTYKFDDIIISIDNTDKLGCFLEAEIHFDNDYDIIDKLEIKEVLINKLIEAKIIDSDYELVTVGYVELYLKKYNITAYNIGLYQE